jgi:DNA (cytosine-5)-methyltransferase 1
MRQEREFDFYEFFAGGGMARAGLKPNWKCVFANDFDGKKAESYRANWGGEHLVVKDVREITTEDLPGEADLSWASFPCQDLSLAGSGGGLKAERSGAFWPFWKLMRDLAKESRSPRLIVLENVYGALTSHDGKDFAAIASALFDSEYLFGAVVVDAIHFVPQSRPRLFIIGVRSDLRVPKSIIGNGPHPFWHPQAVLIACGKIPGKALQNWIWFSIPQPGPRQKKLVDILESEPSGVAWHSADQTRYLLSLMSDLNKEKVALAKAASGNIVGCVYRRTRNGRQRAEVRFDDVAGCLRTPAGGSSRQTLLIVEAAKVSTRLLSPREAARLMGLDDSYILPSNYNAAYHLAGDGVVVPVVTYLAKNVLAPVLFENLGNEKRVA